MRSEGNAFVGFLYAGVIFGNADGSSRMPGDTRAWTLIFEYAQACT